MSAPYHPGQAPWPDNQSQRPDRPPPIQFRPEEQPPRGNTVLAWTLRIVGLIAVAVISGVVWWYIQNDEQGGPTAGGGGESRQQSTGAYEFTARLDSPKVDDTCAGHAYGRTQGFFQDGECVELTRSVFTTTVEGRTVYTSVAVVEMPDEERAGELRELTDTNNTGNVSDLVREGEVPVQGLDQLSGGGYASNVQGTRVVIVEADYDPEAAEGGSGGELDEICTDAIRLGDELVAESGG